MQTHRETKRPRAMSTGLVAQSSNPKSRNRHVVGLTLGGRIAQYAALEYAAARVSLDAGVDVLWFHSADEQMHVMPIAWRLRQAGHNVRAVDALPANGSYCDLNKIRLLPSFWARVQLEAPLAKHVLMFEADSATCGSAEGFAAFISAQQYDYCGAPWPADKDHPWAAHPGQDPRGAVGNAGFSLWRIETAAKLTAARQRELEAREHVANAGRQMFRLAREKALDTRRYALNQAHRHLLNAKATGLRFPALDRASQELKQFAATLHGLPVSAKKADKSLVASLDDARAKLLRVLQAETMLEPPCWETDIIFANWCEGRAGFPHWHASGERLATKQPSFEPPLTDAACHICPLEVASAFAVENMHISTATTPFGFHKPWVRLDAWAVPPTVLAKVKSTAPLQRYSSTDGRRLARRQDLMQQLNDAFNEAWRIDWARRLRSNPCLHVVREIRQLCGRACSATTRAGQPREVVRRLYYWPHAWASVQRSRSHGVVDTDKQHEQREQAILPEHPAALESWPTARYRLILQHDANLVLYQRNSNSGAYDVPTWHSSTPGHAKCPCQLLLQAHVLQLTDSSGGMYFTLGQAKTSILARGGAYFVDLRDDGTLLLSHGVDEPRALIWEINLLQTSRRRAPRHSTSTAVPVVHLTKRQRPVLTRHLQGSVQRLSYWPKAWGAPKDGAPFGGPASQSMLGLWEQAILPEHPPAALQSWPNGRYRLQVQADANLVMYRRRGGPGGSYDLPVWASSTLGKRKCPCKLILQQGVLKLLDHNDSAFFALGHETVATTSSRRAFFADLGDDGRLRLSRGGNGSLTTTSEVDLLRSHGRKSEARHVVVMRTDQNQ